jgi:hypothetical protein
VQRFLDIARKYKHHVIPVLFDDCWKSVWGMGKQPNPVPGLHNSQWVQCPGTVPMNDTILQSYVVGVISRFRNDDTIVMWDLYNEVGNSGYFDKSLPLVIKVFNWSRSANPKQPLTSGYWNSDTKMSKVNSYILSESDVISFHAYCDK